MHSECRLFLLTGVMTLAAAVAHAAVGDPLPNLKPQETKFFSNGKLQFQRVWGLREGVGPVFVDGSCERCHNVPTIGGGSTRHWTFFGKLDQDGTFDPLDGTGPSGENEGGIMLQPRST